MLPRWHDFTQVCSHATEEKLLKTKQVSLLTKTTYCSTENTVLRKGEGFEEILWRNPMTEYPALQL
jgi:hypothetical protein